jgi:RsmE family RNA methyltransferase
MNLILLYPSDYTSDDRVQLNDARLQHVIAVLKAKVGEHIRVGDLNGRMGLGCIVVLTDELLELSVCCDVEPPQPAPLNLVLALPRPKVFKRILITATTLGIKRIYLINSWRVDKSYWGSPCLNPDEINKQLVTGLEQARDTVLPVVTLHSRFKPFVEDELCHIAEGGPCYVAHPHNAQPCPQPPLCPPGQMITVVVGPEGGFIEYEVDKLIECNFTPIEIGTRILRVETAVTKLTSLLIG